MTVAEYANKVSHREHRAWCFFKEILRLPKKQTVLPDGTPIGPRPVTKEDIGRIHRINWQRQVGTGAVDAKEQLRRKRAQEAAELRRRNKRG